MKASFLRAALACALAAPALLAQHDSDVKPNGKGDLVQHPLPQYEPPQALSTTATTSSNGISYHGGPVMTPTKNVYYIWYGNWAQTNGQDDATAKSIVTNFGQYVGGSPYFNINTTYTDAYGNKVANSVAYQRAVSDAYSQGSSLTDSSVASIVARAINNGSLPSDTNGVYFVLTSSDVNETSGFCTQYCGWHTHANINGRDIKYSFVGNAARCPSACEAQSTSPNGRAGADAMVSILAHELEEATTDPDLNAWYDASGYENADKCAWKFGTVYKASNGSYYNMVVGGRDYLVQENWVNASGGYCATKY